MTDKIPDNFKDRKDWLKKKAKESFDDMPIYSDDEPSVIGNPNNIFKDDDELFEDNNDKENDNG